MRLDPVAAHAIFILKVDDFVLLDGVARLHAEHELAVGFANESPIRAVDAAVGGAVFDGQNVLGETIAWAVPCISGRGRRIPANLFGALVATNEEPRKVTFVGRKGARVGERRPRQWRERRGRRAPRSAGPARAAVS